MLDVAFQPQLPIAIAERPRQICFQPAKAPDFLAHICELVFEHGLHIRTNVMFFPQRQQFSDFGQREPQLLSMANELEVANLFSAEQAISARAPISAIEKSEFLIEADRVDADAGQLCGLTDVNRLCHRSMINPGVTSRVKTNSLHRLPIGTLSPYGIPI